MGWGGSEGRGRVLTGCKPTFLLDDDDAAAAAVDPVPLPPFASLLIVPVLSFTRRPSPVARMEWKRVKRGGGDSFLSLTHLALSVYKKVSSESHRPRPRR